MKDIDHHLGVGNHRPVYLWAGPGTIRMNRLKFMGAAVDEAVHHEAHTVVGAQRMAEAGFNWAYLMYDWGFPLEIEREDWLDFYNAVQVYQAAGLRVFGYIQASNCVYTGSYREKDWYALDPRRRKFYYYTGRYMTCWSHPGWLEHLRQMVLGVIESGADGVFFDNPWHACQPIHFAGAWVGFAGCYCPRCQSAYRGTYGHEIPTITSPGSVEGRRYLTWRAKQVSCVLQMLADYARSLNSEALVSCNNFDAVMRPSTLIYGIDLETMAMAQDVIMIEDYGLPRWEPGPKPLLVNNVLTLRTARTLIGDTPLSSNPYDRGIGFDGVYPPRRFQQGMAEAAACGAAMVVKGTEFIDDRRFTLLTAQSYAAQRQAIGNMHSWLREYAPMYQGRHNLAPVGLVFPGERLWQHWDRLSPAYFMAGQALLAAGIPWQTVSRGAEPPGLEALLYFGEPPPLEQSPQAKRIDVLSIPGWQLAEDSIVARHAYLHRLASKLVGELYRSYFRYRWARRLGDSLGLVHRFLQSPYFHLPGPERSNTLLDKLSTVSGELPYPRVRAEQPVLLEVWGKGCIQQLHLVNYAAEAQVVTVEFGAPVKGRAISPTSAALDFSGETFQISIDVYLILELSLQ